MTVENKPSPINTDGGAYKSTRIKRRRKRAKKTRNNGLERRKSRYRRLSHPPPSIRSDLPLPMTVIGDNNRVLILWFHGLPNREASDSVARILRITRFITGKNLLKLFCLLLLLYLLHLLGV